MFGFERGSWVPALYVEECAFWDREVCRVAVRQECRSAGVLELHQWAAQSVFQVCLDGAVRLSRDRIGGACDSAVRGCSDALLVFLGQKVDVFFVGFRQGKELGVHFRYEGAVVREDW